MDNWLDDWWSAECCQQISTVEYVDNSKRRLRFCQSTRTPNYLIVRIGNRKYEAKVTNNRRLSLRMRSS